MDKTNKIFNKKAVCSKECHAKYVEETKSCIFHENFNKDLSGQVRQNIFFLVFLRIFLSKIKNKNNDFFFSEHDQHFIEKHKKNL